MSVLNVRNDAELLSYIINIEPELRENIDLPVQGESIAPIGQVIVNNQRYAPSAEELKKIFDELAKMNKQKLYNIKI